MDQSQDIFNGSQRPCVSGASSSDGNVNVCVDNVDDHSSNSDSTEEVETNDDDTADKANVLGDIDQVTNTDDVAVVVADVVEDILGVVVSKNMDVLVAFQNDADGDVLLSQAVAVTETKFSLNFTRLRQNFMFSWGFWL